MNARIVALIACIVAGWPTVAGAQETVDLSATQEAYNDQGVALVADGEFQQAIQRFRASLAIGEANITWLNLGRTYQRVGDCAEAKEAYAHVESAPAVAAPTPDEIATVLKKYRSELPEECPEPAEEPPVQPAEDLTQTAPAPSPGETDTETGTELTPAPVGTSWRGIGVGIACGGGATLAGALLVNRLLLKPKVEALEDAQDGDEESYDRALYEAEQAQTIDRVLLFAGAGLTLAGVGMFVASTMMEAEVAFVPSSDGGTLVLRGQW